MTERAKLITEHLSGNYSVSELARRFEVSRKNIYKWIKRYGERGLGGLADFSRARHHQHRAIGAEMERQILELKARWPDWGAPKIRAKLKLIVGVDRCPAESTVSAALKRHGLVKSKRRRNRAVHGGAGPMEHCTEANAVWCVDFKGWWETLDGKRFEPLTVSDGSSRYLLRCVGLSGGTGGQFIKPHFEMLFREYGLPAAIRSDNGAPFASTGLGGLTVLSAWWVRLGITLERITPGCPQENGRHERMHLTLEKSSARKPRKNQRQQQEALEKFRNEYNNERPHEALDDKVPAEFYQPSTRTYSGRVPAPREYPEEWQTRKVRTAGQVKWGGENVRVTYALAGEYIGFEPIGKKLWKVWFEHLELGVFDENLGVIKRHTRLPKMQTSAQIP